jgi:hypothetical protein
VNSGSVSITSAPPVTYQPAPAAAPAAVYVPYYLPIVVRGEHRGFERSRFERSFPAPSAPRQSTTAAFPIAPRLVVPSSSELRSFTGRRRP